MRHSVISEVQIESVISKLSSVEVNGSFFRMISQKRSQAIESVSASLMRGGRFNPPLAFGALYLGESEETCLDEVMFHAGGNFNLLKPLVTGKFHLHLGKVLDLTNPKVKALFVKALKIKEDDLKQPGTHTLTRVIGKVARKLGFEGVLFHSAASPGNKNLAVFIDSLGKGSRVKKISVRPVKM